jgi:hypothetical protein
VLAPTKYNDRFSKMARRHSTLLELEEYKEIYCQFGKAPGKLDGGPPPDKY